MLVITFDPNNGGSAQHTESELSKDGAALTALIPFPTNEGHSIEGWYYDNNGTETKWNFDTDTVKCTMTLKAKWELSTYSVTLQTDGGTIASGKRSNRRYTTAIWAILPTTNDITAGIPLLTAGTQTATFPVHPSQRSQVPIREIKRSTQNGREHDSHHLRKHDQLSWSTTRGRQRLLSLAKQNIRREDRWIPSQQRRKPAKALPANPGNLHRQRNVEEDQQSGGYRDFEALL